MNLQMHAIVPKHVVVLKYVEIALKYAEIRNALKMFNVTYS